MAPTTPSEERPTFGTLLVEGAREAIAHKRGELDAADVTLAKVTLRHVDVRPPPAYLGQEIQRVREELGLSQTVFAGLLGASAATVRAWERGAREPSDMARRLLQILERDPEAFLDELVTSS